LKAVLQCPGFAAQNAILPHPSLFPSRSLNASSAFCISIVKLFRAALLTLYATTAVGGKLPLEDLVRDARPEDILMTLGLAERCNRGRKLLVTTATEVMFALKVLLKFSLKSGSS
jgi:hypothetical protein